MTDKFIVEPRYCIENSDLNVVGEMLGMDWNDVCDLISDAGLYGQDGAGYVVIDPYYKYGTDIDKIIEKIFADNPGVTDIYVMDC